MTSTNTRTWLAALLLAGSISGLLSGCSPEQKPEAPAPPRAGADAPQPSTGGAQAAPSTPTGRD